MRPLLVNLARNLWRLLPLAVLLSPALRAEIATFLHTEAGAIGVLGVLFGIALLPMLLVARRGKEV